VSEKRSGLAAKIATLRQMVAEVAAAAAEVEADFDAIRRLGNGQCAEAMVLTMLRQGATIAAVCAATEWNERQAHSFLNWQRQLGMKITWTEVNGRKCYRLSEQPEADRTSEL